MSRFLGGQKWPESVLFSEIIPRKRDLTWSVASSGWGTLELAGGHDYFLRNHFE